MSHVCVSVCLTVRACRLHGSTVQTAKPTDMPLGADAWHVGPRNHVLDGVKIGRIQSQPRGLQVGDAAFCQITLDTCFISQQQQQQQPQQ